MTALPLLLGVCLTVAAYRIADGFGVALLAVTLLVVELVADHRRLHQEQADRLLAATRFGEWTDA